MIINNAAVNLRQLHQFNVADYKSLRLSINSVARFLLRLLIKRERVMLFLLNEIGLVVSFLNRAFVEKVLFNSQKYAVSAEAH